MQQLLARPHNKKTKYQTQLKNGILKDKIEQKLKKMKESTPLTLRKIYASTKYTCLDTLKGRCEFSVMRNIQNIRSIFLAFSLVFFACTAQAKARQPAVEPILTFYQVDKKVQAKSAYLVDAKTNKVLFARNASRPYPPASTLKLMTALIVYENKKHLANNMITVIPSDTKVEPSHVPLIAGEQVQVDTLLKALLVGSDNDSAMALARHTAGSVPQFVNMMNQKAIMLGCQNTRFMNPHGLPISGQFTTAMDLLRIFQATIKIPELRRIGTTQAFKLNTEAGPQIVRNHNKLLGRYEGMGPAKTGWTASSRHTYAASASRNGQELHLVILNSPNKWTDAKALFDYGFMALSNAPTLSAVGKNIKTTNKVTSIKR